MAVLDVLRYRFDVPGRVGGIGRRSAVVAVGAHQAVPVIIVDLHLRPVHGNLVIVYSQTVTLRVSVNKQSALKELVRGKSDAGHHMGRV